MENDYKTQHCWGNTHTHTHTHTHTPPTPQELWWRQTLWTSMSWKCTWILKLAIHYTYREYIGGNTGMMPWNSQQITEFDCSNHLKCSVIQWCRCLFLTIWFWANTPKMKIRSLCTHPQAILKAYVFFCFFFFFCGTQNNISAVFIYAVKVCHNIKSCDTRTEEVWSDMSQCNPFSSVCV